MANISKVYNELSGQNESEKKSILRSLSSFESFVEGVLNITVAARTLYDWWTILRKRFGW